MLKIGGLTAWYVKNKNILIDLSFEIKEHSITGLLGLNGAGKTTLINILSSVHKSYKAQEVLYKGDLIDLNNVDWKNKRYTVFTEEQAFSYWTFDEYMHFLHKAYQKDVNKDHMGRLIEGFRFEDYVNCPIKNLSTGNRKKVFLITGFALELPLLILDEPLDGLDFLSSEFLYKEILEYKKYGSLVMSSHIAESIEKTCDQVFILQDGNIEMHILENNSDIRSYLNGWLHEGK